MQMWNIFTAPSGKSVDTPGLISRLLLMGPENAMNLFGTIQEMSWRR